MMMNHSLLRWVGVMLVGGLAFLSFAAQQKPAAGKPAAKATSKVAPAAAGELYVKKDTWAQTMVASRAALNQRDASIAGEKANSFKPYVAAGIKGEAEEPHRVSVDVTGINVLRLSATLDQGGGNCHIWGDAKLIAADGSEVLISSLRPLSIRVGWGQLYVDQNWQKNPLQIGKKKFAHGIWVHSNSEVCYLLGGKYTRFEAFVGMDAARAIGVATFRVDAGGADFTEAVWQAIARDFPRQSQAFAKDVGRNYLDWFRAAASPRIEQGIINRIVVQLGLPTAGPLAKELEQLNKSKTAAGDPAWLELYTRAWRYRETQAALDRIGLADVQGMLARQRDELARVNGDDKRWDEICARAGRYAQALAPLGDVRIAGLATSIQTLGTTSSGRFASTEALRNQLATLEAKWKELTPALLRDDPAVPAQVAQIAAQVKDLRRQMLLAMPGMQAALAGPVDLVKEWESQFEVLRHDIANRATFEKFAGETFRESSLILPGDRDPLDVVLRRTAALMSHLGEQAPQVVAPARKELAAIAAAAAQVPVEQSEARFALFADACRVRRGVAFANPLVASIDQLLFIKRHRPIYQHMCDQYYGMTAKPGGGLYAIKNPFGGGTPEVRDVLANSTVANGRLKGQKLSGGPLKDWKLSFDGAGNLSGEETEGGSFLSPDLSPDGKSILFAYVECRGSRLHEHHVDPTRGHWDAGRCYHVFRVNVDGGDLRLLTDGTWNEFDPAWLPNGRIAFISERRGGYLRCGRVCPTYTLYDMAADGSDITMLSPHETNEWHPSVTNDGRIVYTRWDYVDRHGCTAHMPWITTLDGRDSRHLHGNFAPRNARPDMELDVRAIPGSSKFSATAAPHHGQAYGSIILIDPNVPDDDGMGPVRRVTPDTGFPESQGGPEAYGNPLPLSEDFYLSVYDADMALRKPGAPGHYGIYLVDSFGNKELVYRDPRIGCQSPIPLRATVAPPVGPVTITKRTDYGPGTGGPADPTAKATLTVINAYDSLRPWPDGTRITALRILQVLPMTTPSGGLRPHETGLRLPEAGDSVVPVRYVLGTVPVEKDGSAHFVVPANREFFFQALDERGLAVQSMRSATYLKEGEQLTCQGCHETKHAAPSLPKQVPLAVRREPSVPKSDVEGSNPFSYPKLVQPVLDRHCVQCHEQNKSKTFSLAKDPVQGHFYTSYVNLAGRYTFRSYGSGYRTTPGQFGARASKLFDVLEKGHYDVKLSPEEMHRLTLWMDCMSMFYGVYEREGGQAQLRGEVAKPTLE